MGGGEEEVDEDEEGTRGVSLGRPSRILLRSLAKVSKVSSSPLVVCTMLTRHRRNSRKRRSASKAHLLAGRVPARCITVALAKAAAILAELDLKQFA